MNVRKLMLVLLLISFCFLLVSIVLMAALGGVFEEIHKGAGACFILLVLYHVWTRRGIIKNMF